MSDTKSTKLSIRDDRPTALSSSAHGSNLDAIGFNLAFIARRQPRIAVEILKLYSLAHKVQESDPPAPDEDFGLFTDELRNTLSDDEEG